MTDIKDTLAQRAKSHGKYEDHAQYAQEIKDIIQKSVSYDKLSQDQRETLHMIAHKMGRILAGNPDFFDHWHDIAGYATLSAKLCSDAPGKKKEDQKKDYYSAQAQYQIAFSGHDDDNVPLYVVVDRFTFKRASKKLHFHSARELACSLNNGSRNGND